VGEHLKSVSLKTVLFCNSVEIYISLNFFGDFCHIVEHNVRINTFVFSLFSIWAVHLFFELYYCCCCFRRRCSHSCRQLNKWEVAEII